MNEHTSKKIISVLVVEDESVIANDIRHSLMDMGYKVADVVGSGEEAISAAKEHRPDLVLMDIMLRGGMDGIEAAEQISECCDIPVVYLTAYADEELLERTKSSETYGYIIKPFENTELHFAIEMGLYKHMTGKKLREQNEFINNILKSLTHPLYVINVKDYTIELANPAANLGDLSEKTTCYSVTHKRDRPCSGKEHPCTIEEVLKTRSSVILEHTHYDKDGNIREVEVHGYPIFDKEGEISRVIEYTLDITDRKRLERQFIESQKLESVGRLAGGVAHDFSNIMSAVLGYSEMALMELPENHPTADKIKMIRDAGEKAATLTSQLLAFSSKQALKMKPVNLKLIVEEMAKMLERVIGENITMKVHADAPVKNVMADKGQIEQVIMNLSINARDAISEEGSIDISIRDRELDEDFTRARKDLEPGPYVELSVRDNGAGIERDVLENIFEPFFTTKQSGKGTGLGLSTVYGIVKQHRGHIQVESSPGRGTMFTIYIPAASLEAQEAAPADPISMPKGNEVVLAVDDEPSILMLISDTLTPLGYRVHRAHSTKDAIALSREHTDIDILLTDIVMPGANGWELANQIKAERPAIKIIYMSGYSELSISGIDSLKADESFLQKPIRPSVLAKAIREVLKKD